MNITYSVISKTGRRFNNEDSVKVMDYSEDARWLGVVCEKNGDDNYTAILAIVDK